LTQRFVVGTAEVDMRKKSLTIKVLAAEILFIAALGTLVSLYTRSVDKAARKSSPPQAVTPTAAQEKPPDAKAIDSIKAKPIAELAKTIDFRPEVDLVVFVIDTSASMQDDRDSLKNSVNNILSRYKGRAFNVVNFANTAEITGEPTRDLKELKSRIDNARDLGGDENSYLAVSIAADKAHKKFKNPAIVLMTDAAPHDGTTGSFSKVTMNQASDAINAANAELHVWAGFDQNEFMTGGSATTTSLYLELLGKVKAGGQIHEIR
jgi:Mg-chelatase subunit ChlD